MASYSRGPGRGAAARAGRAAMSLARRSTDSPRADIDRPAPAATRAAAAAAASYVTLRAPPGPARRVTRASPLWSLLATRVRLVVSDNKHTIRV